MMGEVVTVRNSERQNTMGVCVKHQQVLDGKMFNDHGVTQ